MFPESTTNLIVYEDVPPYVYVQSKLVEAPGASEGTTQLQPTNAQVAHHCTENAPEAIVPWFDTLTRTDTGEPLVAGFGCTIMPLATRSTLAIGAGTVLVAVAGTAVGTGGAATTGITAGRQAVVTTLPATHA